MVVSCRLRMRETVHRGDSRQGFLCRRHLREALPERRLPDLAVLAQDVADACVEERGRRPVPDGSVVEFFTQLQKNVLDRTRRDTRNELRQAIMAWLEPTDHHRHRQAHLGRLTPVESETIDAAALEPLTRVSTEPAAVPQAPHALWTER